MRKKIAIASIVCMLLICGVSVSATVEKEKAVENQLTQSLDDPTVWDTYSWSKVYDSGWRIGYSHSDVDDVEVGDFLLIKNWKIGGNNHREVYEVVDIVDWQGGLLFEVEKIDYIEIFIEWTHDIFMELNEDGTLLEGEYEGVEFSIDWSETYNPSLTFGAQGLSTTIEANGQITSEYGWNDLIFFSTSGNMVKSIIDIVCFGDESPPSFHQSYTFKIGDTTVFDFEIDSTDAVPEIEITKPTNGIYFMGSKVMNYDSSFIFGSGLTVETWVSASANSGAVIEKVEFYINGDKKSTDRSSPYEWDWDGIYIGSYTLKVKVYNSHGRSASDSITCTCIFF